MKIVTWNINGIRSLKKHVKEILRDLDGDIVCFQETKISRSQLPEDMALVDGYSSYFSFPKWQSGYSGVATYCQDSCTPTKAEEGLCGNLSSVGNHSNIGNTSTFSGIASSLAFDLGSLDNEGRVVMTEHEIKNGSHTEKLVVINVYCPRVDCEKPERKVYKMQFCQLLEARAKSLVQEGYHVVIAGDMNIAHQPIDHCDPGDEREFKSHEARMWMTSFLSSGVHENEFVLRKDALGFADTFRFHHPDQKEAYTCWNTLTGARQTNYGTRIDYILSSKPFLPFITSCEILSTVLGSDHCPVRATYCCEPVPSSKLPSSCCRLWPEFSGQQQKLLNFLSKTVPTFKTEDAGDYKRKTDDLPTSQREKKSKTKNGLQKQKAITNFFVNNRVKPDKSAISENASSKGNGIDGTVQTEVSAKSGFEKSNDKTFESVSEQTELSSNFVNCNSSDKVNCAATKIQSEMWKRVLSGPPAPPLCKGHGKACVLRTVKKEGPNFGRQFFACPQPNGPASNPESRCNFFQWVTPSKISTLKKK